MLTNRQEKIRREGLERAREMKRNYDISVENRKDIVVFVKIAGFMLAIATIQTIYILCK